MGCLLFWAVLGPVSTAHAADDDVLIIDDSEVKPGDDGVIRFDGDDDGAITIADDADDDDIIVIVDEGDLPAPSVDVPTGPLGRIWDSWHVALDSEVFVAAQMTDPENGPLRALGSAWLESWLLPAPNLSFYGTGLGRIAWDGTPEGRVVAFVDVYELYARITLDRATVNLGRLVVPWGRTQAAALGDRLHPPDLRRGGAFPDPARQKQPQLGAQLKGSAGVVGLEAVGFVTWEPTEGALSAANQGGVRVARYQTALARSPLRSGGLLIDDDTSGVRPTPALVQPTVAARAWRRIGEIDVTASAAWHFDETPTLTLSPDVAHALGAEGLALRGLPSQPAVVVCESGLTACIGQGALTHQQTTSIGLDASWGLGLVVARAEALVYPRVGLLAGKTALVLDASGVRSVQVGQLAAAVAVEGQLGPAIDGSLEVFHLVWDGVPGDAKLWGVEVLNADVVDDPAVLRTVHRLAVGANLGGALFDERVQWRLRGEAGLLQADVLMSAEVRYRLPVFDLYLGGRGDVFTGMPGSPGWMREEASLVGIFLGEGV